MIQPLFVARGIIQRVNGSATVTYYRVFQYSNAVTRSLVACQPSFSRGAWRLSISGYPVLMGTTRSNKYRRNYSRITRCGCKHPQRRNEPMTAEVKNLEADDLDVQPDGIEFHVKHPDPLVPTEVMRFAPAGKVFWNGREVFSDAELYQALTRMFKAYDRRMIIDSCPQFDFGTAIVALKAGLKVSRQGWNGKNMHLRLQRPEDSANMTLPYIAMYTVQGDLVPWLASQTDMLANDWVLVRD